MKNYKNVIQFILIFFSVYLVMALLFWIYGIYSTGRTMLMPTEKYASIHQQELKDRLFGTIFNEGKRCQMYEKLLREQCEKEITFRMALLIKEEEFEDENKNGWPHDIFFVKQEENSFYRLGWEGKVVNISSTVDKILLDNRTPFTFRVITHQCRVFEQTINETLDCQIFTSLPLENNNRGYIVRRVGVGEEENDFVFLFIFIPLALPLALFNGYLYPEGIVIFGIYFLLPALITVGIIKGISYYNDRRKNKV
ncbi:MAG: hypothetical protein M3Q44_06210 [bacterium]|nr:hypothetical protein [bacterium]